MIFDSLRERNFSCFVLCYEVFCCINFSFVTLAAPMFLFLLCGLSLLAFNYWWLAIFGKSVEVFVFVVVLG